jgi:TonB family protein
VSTRRLAAALVLCVSAASPAGAQAPPPAPVITPEELLAGSCGVLIPSVQPLQDAGRYLLTFRRRTETPRLAVVVRVDDRTGHWLYPPATAPQAIIVVPDTVSPPINVMPASAGGPSGDEVACAPDGRTPPAQAPIPAPDVPVLTPASRVADAAATCAVPFASSRMIGTPPRPTFATATRQPGTVKVRIDANPDGTVRDVTVLAAPNAAMGEELATAARTMTFEPEIFRCTPVRSHTFYAVTLRSNGPG